MPKRLVEPSPLDGKRIVLLQTQGKHAGLYQIVGTVREVREEQGELPEQAAEVPAPPNDRLVACRMDRVGNSYVLYREMVA